MVPSSFVTVSCSEAQSQNGEALSPGHNQVDIHALGLHPQLTLPLLLLVLCRLSLYLARPGASLDEAPA